MVPTSVSAAASTSRRPWLVHLLTRAQRRMQGSARGDLLMALKAGDRGVPMKRVGVALGLGAPALSGLVDRMTRDGLVERQADPDDGRAWTIVLTDAGRRARNEAIRAARLLNDRLGDGFDDAELATVARWLEAVGDLFPPAGGRG